MLLTACADETVADMPNHSGIVFGVDVSVMDRSRAASPDETGHFKLYDLSDTIAVTRVVEDMRNASRATPADGITSFRAWAYLHDSGRVIPFFANEEVTDRGAYWATANTYYWPGAADRKLSFSALAGIPDQGMEIDSESQTFSLRYTTPADAAAQTDVMLAETEPLNGSGIESYRVPLNFRHICAAVRFRAGKTLQPGSIEKITLSGIHASGRYTGGAWSDLADSRSFSIDSPVTTTGSETAGDDLYPAYRTFMFVPQLLGPDARLEVVFRDDITGATRTLAASLAGHEWPIGRITTYNIGISPDYGLEFTTEPPVQDAHYVMCNTSIKVSGLLPATTWTLTAAASDGADVTIQRESDVNEYARQGFWLDKTMVNGVVQNQSARGTSVISGSGNADNLEIRVFIPENTRETTREITLTLQVDGAPAANTVTQTISQLCPLWNGQTGWEQLYGEDRGIYGFCYDALHVYVYNNSHTIVPANQAVNQVNALITQYGASHYASVTRYSSGFASYRNYVAIDYGKLNQLSGKSVSTSDGLRNTLDLFSFGGTAVSRNFENALLYMERINSPGVKAYRRRADNDPNAVPQWIDGAEIDDSQALAVVLKKNRYYLNTANEGDMTTTTPMILTEDIVWYWPASDQIREASDWSVGSKSDFWSSTSAEGSDAYTGDGSPLSRATVKSIRVARNRP